MDSQHLGLGMIEISLDSHSFLTFLFLQYLLLRICQIYWVSRTRWWVVSYFFSPRKLGISWFPIWRLHIFADGVVQPPTKENKNLLGQVCWNIWAYCSNAVLKLRNFRSCKSGIVGFLRGGCSRGGGNWGTLRIPKKDWGTLGNIGED